jgi:tRNA-Thr(GGU) m(6)t(6)A37 methyltransferase TsaA
VSGPTANDPSTPELAHTGPFLLQPIGVVHSPFQERLQAPRQPQAARGIEGTVELFPASGIEHALEDLASFQHIWLLFWFHKNPGFRPKVLPPRSAQRRGVFATRSPYRPNPIGMSALELVGIEGRVLRVRNLDILDQTPVLDIKPYLAYTDAIPDANSGWLGESLLPADPLPDFAVEFSPEAAEQLAFLAARGVALASTVEEVLRLGPTPHPYRRIRPNGNGFVLAHKEWRFEFTVEARRVLVHRVKSGYRPSEIHDEERAELGVHREFVGKFR